jgi:integrase
VTWRQLDVLSNVAGLFQSAGLRIGTGGRELADAGLIVSPFGSNRVKIWVARRVGIKKQIGWHTFRRTYSSLLAETGNDVKVVQELMRHSKLSTTMEVYTQVGMTKKACCAAEGRRRVV